MKCVIGSKRVFLNGEFTPAAVLIEDGLIADILPDASKLPQMPGVRFFDLDSSIVIPGLVDVHVHLREPGFSYKETVRSGTAAAARGGFTTVCAMPNLSPVPDGVDALNVQLDAIRRDAAVNVLPYGAITKGQQGEELAELEAMAPLVAGYSDDGRGVQSDALMKSAMAEARRLGKMIVAHCEDNALLPKGGCIHDGAYAKAHGLVGISSESEWRQLKRDLMLVKETGVSYHMCHVSTKESVRLLREARAAGLPVTGETAPHYLLLNDAMLADSGAYKMNPPIRARDDQEALVEAVCDGTITVLATDHAPHTAAEKSGGLQNSLMGIVGLETAFPVLYTGLVRTGLLTAERLVMLMSVLPAERFGLPSGLEIGKPADLAAFDLEHTYTIDSGSFASMGKSTPFDGTEVFGRPCLTVVSGQIVYDGMERK